MSEGYSDEEFGSDHESSHHSSSTTETKKSEGVKPPVEPAEEPAKPVDDATVTAAAVPAPDSEASAPASAPISSDKNIDVTDTPSEAAAASSSAPVPAPDSVVPAPTPPPAPSPPADGENVVGESKDDSGRELPVDRCVGTGRIWCAPNRRFCALSRSYSVGTPALPDSSFKPRQSSDNSFGVGVSPGFLTRNLLAAKIYEGDLAGLLAALRADSGPDMLTKTDSHNRWAPPRSGVCASAYRDYAHCFALVRWISLAGSNPN